MAIPICQHLHLIDLVVAILTSFLCAFLIRLLTCKGPMLWPVFGIIPTIFLHIDDIYDWTTAALHRIGGTFSFRGAWLGGSFGVMTADPANVEYILRTRFANFPKGSYYCESFADFLGDGIFNSDGKVWRKQRRAAAAEMHSSRFASYSVETIRELVSAMLLPLLDRVSSDGEIAYLQDVFLRFAFDNICAAAFGVDSGCLAVGLPEVPFAKAFEGATEFSLFRFVVLPFVRKPMRLLGVGTERRLKLAVRTVHDFAEKTVSNRRAKLKILQTLADHSDLLSRFLEAEVNFSDKYLKDFCISFILAGRDTNSVVLAWFFWLLDKHPQVEKRILEEIFTTIKKRSAKINEVLFTVDELKGMHYLHAALSETMRLYPSVPVDFKEVLEDDVLPNGTVVKKGAKVIYSMYAMGRTEAIRGNDCTDFRPERWTKDGVFVSESDFKYPVFNAGPRLCIGKKFAYVQMKMVVAAILMRFHVEVVEGQEVAPKLNATLYMKSGLKVWFRRRGEVY